MSSPCMVGRGRTAACCICSDLRAQIVCMIGAFALLMWWHLMWYRSLQCSLSLSRVTKFESLVLLASVLINNASLIARIYIYRTYVYIYVCVCVCVCVCVGVSVYVCVCVCVDDADVL